MPSNGLIDRPFVFFRISIRQRLVKLSNLMPLELLRQTPMRRIGFGYQQQAGGLLIQAVDDPRSQDAADAGKVPAMEKQGIDHGSPAMSRRRMDNDSRRLIDHHNVPIFVNDVQGNVFRKGLIQSWFPSLKTNDVSFS
jgi:hypothetical protein